MGRTSVSQGIKELVKAELIEVEQYMHQDGSAANNRYYPKTICSDSEHTNVQDANKSKKLKSCKSRIYIKKDVHKMNNNKSELGRGSAESGPPPVDYSTTGSTRAAPPVVPVGDGNNNIISINIPDTNIKPIGAPVFGAPLKGELFEQAPPMEKKKSRPPTGAAPPSLEKQLHKQFIKVYHDWFMGRNGGAKPHIAGKDAKAVKTLIGSMRGAVNGHAEAKKEVIAECDLPARVLDAWGFMLKNWHKLTPFLQQQTDLCQISNNFNNIISIIKNGTGKIKPINGGADDSRTPAEKFNTFYERAKRDYPTKGQGGDNAAANAVHG